ncbi:FIG00873082: hypothetical protein [hydrothermal vent metagenome]|uniref:Uncharacterized protein n=1 Tax=hydrothermal vent metagenome TaxID=652676 RepID=A0A3B0VCL5_9ZZZZ
MQFPLTLEFKKIALSPQISVLDANGNLILYVKQKLFKLKEAITVFADREQAQPLYTINADRVIDFSARYHFKDSNGIEIGSIKRNGRRSIWKARYDVYDSNEQPLMGIEEQDAWVKVMDGLFSEIPIVGMFAGYFFNPVYLVERPDDSLALKVSKNKSFLESSFTITQESPLSEQEQLQTVLGVLMMTLLERSRG